jgi:hypothetical protein
MLTANAGIPMVCVSIPTMLLALFPIAWVESLFYRSALNLDRKDAFWGSVAANVWSTWGIETAEQRLHVVTLQAPWLIPYQGDTGWMIPAASLVLLFPFYVASVLVEYLVLKNRWRREKKTLALTTVMTANALSYAGLALYYGMMLWLATRGTPSS